MKKILILILMIGGLLVAQKSATVTLNINDFNELSLNDLDIFGTGNVKNLIQASLTYSGFAGDNLQLRLRITRNGVQLLTASTNEVAATDGNIPGIDSKTLNSGVQLEGSVLKIGSYNFDNSVLTAGELALGALPNGNYKFYLSVFSNGIQVGASAEDELNINNDWQIDLSAPADWEIVNNRPFFQWTTNTELFAHLTLYIWEINSPGATDDEITGQPPVYEVEVTNNTDHQYPPTAPQFINGKSYAWTVKGTVRKVSGDVQLNNIINKFTYQTAGNAASTARILGILRSILQSNYDGVMKEFKGYNPTGVIKLNGTATTATDLSALINAIQSGQKKIQVETN